MRQISTTLVHSQWRRTLLGGLIAVLMLGSCAVDGAAEVAGVSITAPPVTSPPAPTPIEEFTGLMWDAGSEYTASSFIVPMSFTPNRNGWLSRGAAPSWASMWFDEDGDGATDATLTLMAHRPSLDPDVLVTEILMMDGVRQLTPAVEQFIGSRAMIVVDVHGEPDPQGGSVSECSRPASAQFTTGAGYELFRLDGSFGIPACYTSRIWILEVDGNTLTAVGVAKDQDRFEDMIVWLEDLLATGLEFETGNA